MLPSNLSNTTTSLKQGGERRTNDFNNSDIYALGQTYNGQKDPQNKLANNKNFSIKMENSRDNTNRDPEDMKGVKIPYLKLPQNNTQEITVFDEKMQMNVQLNQDTEKTDF